MGKDDKMKQLLTEWRKYLYEDKKPVATKEELIKIIMREPNQKIFLDSPKGATKKFGGVDPIELPFNYGEYSELINPADNMGWDIIIVPSGNEDDKNLLPVGHVSYTGDEEKWDENSEKEMPNDLINNHKIIVAPDGKYDSADKNLIDKFFQARWQFKEVKWYE